ncbi:MAG: hypothetical protein FWD13_02690 [Treponema sp.]|nr:hypothetical protein [Treponema sp.]
MKKKPLFKYRNKSLRGSLLLITLIFLLSVPCFAENQFSLRLAPVIEAPVGIEHFRTGIGAAISLDWAFWSFSNFNFGVGASGSFSSIPVQIGSPLILMEGKAGVFLQWRPLDRWAFHIAANGGYYQYSRAEDVGSNGLGSLSLGADFYLSPYFSFFANSAFTYRVFSSDPLTSFGAALGIRLNLSEIMGARARVSIEKTEQFRVFPVSWAWYENNPVATVKITNEEPNTITDINLSFYMDSFMNQPWTFATLPSLKPGESVDVPVTALFNEAMLNLTESITANGILQMQYRSLGARKIADSSIQMPIFHRNTLSWDDDRRAAAFVSPRDSAARYFARFVASAIEASDTIRQRAGRTPSNVIYAAAMFEALRLYGITYVIVPATSFVNVKSDESVLDNVSYPYQALYYRGGDCSYLSILFCSLLETLNIDTAFITIPGHIFIAFDVGDDSWQANNRDIIQIDGKRWLPVEITIPGEGFTRAWRTGARQWITAGDQAVLYPIKDCWEVYPSVTVPSSGDHLPEMPDWEEIIRALEREIGRL